jgi:CRP-like cAMP-binding protein
MHSDAETAGAACATCALRDSPVCAALIDHSATVHTRGRLAVRRAFGGAAAHETVYFRDEPSEDALILCVGWAVRFAQFPDGRRQTLSLILPGDPFSARLFFTPALRSSIRALTPVRFNRVSRSDLMRELTVSPDLTDALFEACATESDASDALLTDLGQCSSEERVARLVLRIRARYAARHVIRESTFPFPLRQQDIADIAGLTAVHVSRVLKTFRLAGLMELSRGTLTIKDLGGLERAARNK